jgi:hypothetical protein
VFSSLVLKQRRSLLIFEQIATKNNWRKVDMAIDLEDRGNALENEYFRRQERELIEKMKAKLQAEDAKSLELKCPKCEGTLYETDHENIKIDVCNKCTGVWLDPGELAQIMAKDETGGATGGWFGRVLGK